MSKKKPAIILPAILLVAIAQADSIREQCSLVTAESLEQSTLKDFALDNSTYSIRECVQLDYGTRTFFALSPIDEKDSVCRFTQTPIAEGKLDGEGVEFMRLQTGVACEGQWDQGYVATSKISTKEFADISILLENLRVNPASYLRRIEEYKNPRISKYSEEARRYLLSGEKWQALQVYKSSAGLRTIFKVEFSVPNERDRFHALIIQKLFGKYSVVGLESGNF